MPVPMAASVKKVVTIVRADAGTISGKASKTAVQTSRPIVAACRGADGRVEDTVGILVWIIREGSDSFSAGTAARAPKQTGLFLPQHRERRNNHPHP